MPVRTLRHGAIAPLRQRRSRQSKTIAISDRQPAGDDDVRS